MGLAAPKNRLKISHDPNNTKWTNDTKSFGHKIMTSQGWQPGQYLGAKDAAHAEFHTEANASHIRVSIKDDNLGLGAKVGSGVGAGECTGLDAFQNLLGRLNGKGEDEIEKEQKSREGLKRAIYTEQRWGSIRFVKGGLLVGDKIQPLIEAEAERVWKLAQGGSLTDSNSSSESEEEVPAEKVKKSKKRKLEAPEEAAPEVVAVKIKKSRKKRKSEAGLADEEEVAVALKEVKLSKKKSRKDRGSRPNSEDTPDEEQGTERKKENKHRKREKKERKEKTKAVEAETTKESKKKSNRVKRKAGQGEEFESSESSWVASEESTPLAAESSGRSTPMMQGRHAVRARNIAQKRLASMDVASLNQIFMIKSQT